MEPIHGRHKTSMFAHEDVIGNMPDNVITNILDRLPIHDAVRTGILARNWRFKWTMLSQLVFDDYFFKYLRRANDENDHVRVISRILFQLRGAVTKFALYVDGELDVEDEDIIHWISFLSTKGIKDVTLVYAGEEPFKLPTHFFSCLELKHLTLINCYFNPLPTFHGFPNLLSLVVRLDLRENTRVGEVITRCPLLEILKLDSLGKVKLAEIAKLENLKILSLSLSDLDIHSSRPIIELLGSLPKLQQLELDFENCKLIEGVANKRFSLAFPCLTTLRLSRTCLDDGIHLSCALNLIRSSPNLQTLQISASNCDTASCPRVDENTMGLLDDNTTGLLHLQSVLFEYLDGSENELCLIKYLLDSSLVLKRFVMYCNMFHFITPDQMLKFASKLLKLRPASPVVDIDLS
ncbi:F-box/FBD/LRR-repeat protein At1g13570-like [Bidens hawaiensis]|uniref:F-box/FBD/LRR-repeat protein At1g13570-like n=1 Tax=Bidens hawaiensis TaxID=980011 RepID=UPI00404A60DC